MKATLIITDDDNNKWHFEFPLERFDTPKTQRRAVPQKQTSNRTRRAKERPEPQLNQAGDLSLPLRPFMKKYARGASGPQKFALLIAHLAKGKLDAEVSRAEVEKHWNKMKGLLGASNPAFSTRARDSGWVDSAKFGVYKLLPGWKGALANVR